MPALYQSPPAENLGLTRFRVFSGPGTLFPNERGTSLPEIRDGTSGTILAIEVGPKKAASWIKPGGIPIDSANLLAELGSPREKGYLALLADGSVITLRKDISEKTLRALISPSGSEGVNRPDYLAEYRWNNILTGAFPDPGNDHQASCPFRTVRQDRPSVKCQFWQFMCTTFFAPLR